MANNRRYPIQQTFQRLVWNELTIDSMVKVVLLSEREMRFSFGITNVSDMGLPKIVCANSSLAY